MAQRAVRTPVVIVLLVVLMGSAILANPGLLPASADVTSVTGSAYGYWSDVSLFGGPPSARGPEPAVQLEDDAANSPQEAAVDEAAAVYGPAVVFRSSRIDVRTEGALGADGSVTSSARIQADPDPERRPGPLMYDELESTCTADAEGVTATTTVTNGFVETSYDPDSQLPVTTEPVPENPEPGHTVEGTIDHVGDRFRIVYNEQIENPDGSLTVNAAHMYLLGDIAVGDLIIGQSVCGLTATPTQAEDEGAPTPTPDAETPDADEEEDVAAPVDDEAGGVPLGALLAGALALLAVGAAVAVLLARRGRAAPETPDSPDSRVEEP